MQTASSSTENKDPEPVNGKRHALAEKLIEMSAAKVRAEKEKLAVPNLMTGGGRTNEPIIPPPAPTPPKPPPATPEEIERQRLQAEHARAQRAAEVLARAQKLWECSGVQPRFLDADFDSPGSPLPAAELVVVERVRGLLDAPGMLALIGIRGCGKSWIAAALIREFCRQCRRAKYLRTMEVFRLVRGSFTKKTESERDVIGELVRPELLVLDEVQVRSESEFENNTLIDLIDQRYAALKSTLLIANLAPDALLKNLGTSIESRLREDGGILLCDWESYRTNGKAVAAFPPQTDPNDHERYVFSAVSPGARPSDLSRSIPRL